MQGWANIAALQMPLLRAGVQHKSWGLHLGGRIELDELRIFEGGLKLQPSGDAICSVQDGRVSLSRRQCAAQRGLETKAQAALLSIFTQFFLFHGTHHALNTNAMPQARSQLLSWAEDSLS